ncbi:hypothetical protein [Hymenobacter actinosclerus]|uniref:Uncharacterized protein n=1 Tax=Hymenobacter actinosclerus TaxID=82805 RepID=A0A1I0FJH9_9BACT|nr:hypothetical protein [Hymenobacter actinosclerus]SET57399.1 hypothetical protein SAMN04487998_2266 [Hymenobacter actinosclerus]
MKPLFNLLSSLLILLALTSCDRTISCEGEASEPQPCQAGPLPFTSLETEYGCTYTRNLVLDGAPTTSSGIIRTQAEFNQRVSGACHPQIDFAKYDLIIGQQVLGGGASSSATYVYQRNCTEAGRILQVTLKMGVTNDLPLVSYHVLVPKLPATETVKVEVQVLPAP